MKRFHAFAIVLCLATTGLLANSSRIVMPAESLEARFAADGAYRDGLYVGGLAAEGGQGSRPCIGRWSSEQDRSMFAAGYSRGYSEVLARAGSSAEHAQRAE